VAVNIPSNYNPNKFSFGPGVLSLAGITVDVSTVQEADVTEIGAVRSGGTFAVTRTKLEVPQGSPVTIVKQFVTAEDATLSVTGIEWDLSQLRLALGAGVVDEGSDPESFGFGGDLNIVECAVKFVHTMPSGYTLTIRLWRAQGTGDMTVTFGDDLHEIPYSFRALQSSNEWAGATLGASAQLFKITLDKV